MCEFEIPQNVKQKKALEKENLDLQQPELEKVEERPITAQERIFYKIYYNILFFTFISYHKLFLFVFRVF